MPRSAKLFRIEQIIGGEPQEQPMVAGDIAAKRHAEIMGALRSLSAGEVKASAPAEQDNKVFEQYKREMAEALKLKSELDSIYEAINDTKLEIASLHHSGFKGDQMVRVTDELDAIVGGTEGATETILAAAEHIDESANTLSAILSGDDQGIAIDIQDHTIKIFEACNFQDLTGQRITKVVNALRFIEERVGSMMEIWGGIESFSEIEVIPEPQKHGDDALLNGPALEGDAEIASQDDIDALFD